MVSNAVWFIAKSEVFICNRFTYTHESVLLCSMSALHQSPNLTADQLGLVTRRWAGTRWAPSSSPSQLTQRQRPLWPLTRTTARNTHYSGQQYPVYYTVYYIIWSPTLVLRISSLSLQGQGTNLGPWSGESLISSNFFLSKPSLG